MKPYLIVCVDDEKMILDALSCELQTGIKNVAVEIAESIPEAWEVIEEFTSSYELAVVISDCLMPSGRGDEFLVEVHRRFPGAAKIMLTGGTEPEAIENAIAHADLYAYLNKPWDKDRLLELVRAALSAKN
ncbi:MAG: response regulator [Bacteroidia bacterium]|nr:response regulator [Bacteroidia bacterium]